MLPYVAERPSTSLWTIMSNLLVLGNDKIAGLAYKKISNLDDLDILIDKSTNVKRIIKLLRKKRIQIGLVLKMFWAELSRNGSKPPSHLSSIYSNKDLCQKLQKASYNKVYLFRAGLVINESVLKLGFLILNIHAARIPEYGGIGSINRALKDKVYEQCASLHVITKEIDQGEVLDQEPYILNQSQSYMKNEEIAYNAAISLLVRSLYTERIDSESF